MNYGSSYESYQWLAPGYHFVLQQVRLDSSSVPGWGVSTVFYTSSAIAGTNMIAYENVLPEISTNPASEVLNIRFYTGDVQNAAVTLYDITRKMVGRISPEAISNGANDVKYPVADLPAGLFFVHVWDGTNSIIKKVIIAH